MAKAITYAQYSINLYIDKGDELVDCPYCGGYGYSEYEAVCAQCGGLVRIKASEALGYAPPHDEYFNAVIYDINKLCAYDHSKDYLGEVGEFVSAYRKGEMW